MTNLALFFFGLITVKGLFWFVLTKLQAIYTNFQMICENILNTGTLEIEEMGECPEQGQELGTIVTGACAGGVIHAMREEHTKSSGCRFAGVFFNFLPFKKVIFFIIFLIKILIYLSEIICNFYIIER